jgi:hypothetical protein
MSCQKAFLNSVSGAEDGSSSLLLLWPLPSSLVGKQLLVMVRQLL